MKCFDKGKEDFCRVHKFFSRAYTQGVDGLDVVRVRSDDAEAAVLIIPELIDHFEDGSLVFLPEGFVF